MSENPPETRSRVIWRDKVEGADLVLATLICLTVTFVAVGMAATQTAGPNSLAGILVSDISTGFAAGLCFVLLVIVAPTSSTPRSVGFTTGFSKKFLALGVACGFLLTLLVLGLSVLYEVIFSSSSGDAASSSSLLPVEGVTHVLLLVISGGLLVPLAEEFLFRGLLYTYLRRWGVLVAVSVSAVIFGLLHLSVVQFPLHILSGVVLALLYERSGSLWPSVAMHATYNTLLTVVSGAAIAAP